MYSNSNGNSTAKSPKRLDKLAESGDRRLLKPDTLAGRTGLKYSRIKGKLASYSNPDGNDFVSSQTEVRKGTHK